TPCPVLRLQSHRVLVFVWAIKHGRGPLVIHPTYAQAAPTFDRHPASERPSGHAQVRRCVTLAAPAGRKLVLVVAVGGRNVYADRLEEGPTGIADLMAITGFDQQDFSRFECRFVTVDDGGP